MSQVVPGKWYLPGWRIEQRYAPGVLIGNWAEERYTFEKGTQKHNSTHRIDFRTYAGHRPDVVIRRNALLKNDGLGPQHIFAHHGGRYSSNMISWYDEHYNGRWRESTLPERRDWRSHTLSWMPEKSDHPLQGHSTNFGLLGKLQERWKQQIADETRGDYCSTYSTSFEPFSPQDLEKLRFATPREESTPLHSPNGVNKNLMLRNAGSSLKQPEKLSLPNIVC